MNSVSPPGDGAPLSASFDSLVQSGNATASDVGAFVETHRFPMIEPGSAVFVWKGEAENVELVRWIHTGAERERFSRVPGTELWYLRLAVADKGRFEYKLAVTRNGHEAWVLDPLNPLRAGDPFGENSVCRTWGYEQPEWTLRQGAPAGRIRPFSVRSAVFRETRNENVYLPNGYRSERAHPVVVIHDGRDFNHYADLSTSLDNLIAAGDIPPLVALLIQTRNRMDEYPGGRRHARYLVDELLPVASSKYNLSIRPADRILMGASLGAVASLAAAFRYPGIFGGLVLKSGSFILDERKLAMRPDPVFHRVARLVRALHRVGKLPGTRAFVSTGELEGLASENEALALFLRRLGADVLFKRTWDGHHWHNWRDQLRDGLMWVLKEESNG